MFGLSKNSKNQFDVSTRANDGAEICELVGLYIVTEIHETVNFPAVGLCRDDGLPVIQSTYRSSFDKFGKKLINLFQDDELKIATQTG